MKVPSLWICIFVIIVLVALIVYVSTHRKGVKDSVSQFSNNDATCMYVRLVSEFDSPQIVINQKGGFAMWFPSKVFENSPYESIILKDQQNFLYTTIIIDIPPSKLRDVLSIYGGVYYDSASREFTVRSTSLLANKRILIAVLKYLTDPSITVQSAQNILGSSWSEDLLDNTSFASTTFSDQSDDEIMKMITLNLPLGRSRELMIVQ